MKSLDEPTEPADSAADAETDAQEAWVLRAGAELWRAVVAEAGSPAADTQKALKAVRNALDCARKLRFAGDVTDAERERLVQECARAGEVQVSALQQWGLGRGMHWDKLWGTEWGEALTPAVKPAPHMVKHT